MYLFQLQCVLYSLNITHVIAPSRVIVMLNAREPVETCSATV